MARKDVDYARDEIIELVEGMPSAQQDRVKHIEAGLKKMIANKTFDVTVQAACDRIGYWCMVAGLQDRMASEIERVPSASREHLLSLRRLAEQSRRWADDLREAMRAIVVNPSGPRA